LLSSFSILLSPFIVGHFPGGTDHPIFPVLEPKGGVPSGFEWEFDQGPDFYMDRATRPNDEQTVAGIYFGLHPNRFIASDLAKTEGEIVASWAVTWAVSDPPRCRLRRETYLPYQQSPRHLGLQLHVWVTAADELQLREVMEALKALTFIEVTRSAQAP